MSRTKLPPRPERDNLVIKLDSGQRLDLKRILFAKGLTAHQWFAYLIQQLTMDDPRLVELTEEATTYKKQRMLEGRSEKLDPETIYQIISDELAKSEA